MKKSYKIYDETNVFDEKESYKPYKHRKIRMEDQIVIISFNLGTGKTEHEEENKGACTPQTKSFERPENYLNR